jgi:hypothetical protein
MDENLSNDEKLMWTLGELAKHIDLIENSLAQMKARAHKTTMYPKDKTNLLAEIGGIEDWLKHMEAVIKSASFLLVPESFKKMWTTEQDEWWLLEVLDSNGRVGYLPHHVPTMGMLIIEDDDWFKYVVEQMKAAGNMRISRSAYDEFIAHYIAEMREQNDLDDPGV